MEEAAWRCDAAETILLAARSASQLTRKLYCRESRVGVQEGKLHTSPQQQGDGLKEERGGNRSISNGPPAAARAPRSPRHEQVCTAPVSSVDLVLQQGHA